MNRSILIVICDFLLVSLLAFSTIDINKVGQGGVPRLAQNKATATPGGGQQDLGDAMRLALEEERRNRDQLLGELARSRALVAQQNQQIQTVSNQLQSKEQLAAGLAEQQVHLQRQFAIAQTNLASLNEQLNATTVETAMSEKERAAVEAKAQEEAEKAAALGKQLAQLQHSNQLMQIERQALQNQLGMSEGSNRIALAQVSQLKDEVETQRQENTHLADGIKDLAAKSAQLAHEIHENRQLTANMIFEDLSSNRVLVSFTGLKSGLFGISSTRNRQTQIALVTDGTADFALCHVQDTPLTLWSPDTKWENLSGVLMHAQTDFPIQSLSFWRTDPRVVMIPVPAAQVQALGCRVYRLSKDPYLFQDAVVVGTREDYYGECKFEIDVTTPEYLKMDHNSLKGLFGKFNPSSGDLVFSKSGELMGLMVNDSYCALISNLNASDSIRFGPDVRNSATQTLSSLYPLVADLPSKLQ